jgi:hypothetical protein
MKRKDWAKLTLAILVVQLFLINICYATNWQMETPWKNKTIYYVDTDSIQVNKESSEIKFLMKSVSPYGYHHTSLVLYNYKTKYFSFLQIKEYDNHNKLIKSTPCDLKDKKLIEAGSLMEAIINQVLSYKGLDREIIKPPLSKREDNE